MKTVIAHISDFHCGSPYYVPELAETVVREVNALEPDLVVMTGDLTDMGLAQEFEFAEGLMQAILCPARVVIPGNHDARNVGDVHFEDRFGPRTSELTASGIHVLALDSSEPDLDSGHVGRERYRWIAERFEDPDEFKVLCLHHHLVPVPGTGRERNIVHDAGDLLRVLERTGVELVLCGHKHVPNVWRVDDMIIVNAGTCCTLKLRGRIPPSYNIIEIHDNGRMRVRRKQPGGPSEVVADFRRTGGRTCRWRPSYEFDDLDEGD